MMNLVSRCSKRTPDVLASTASESPVKTRFESQLPLSSWTEQHLRTGRLVKDAYSSSYSEWNTDEQWSSQEWASDGLMEVRTGRPVLYAQHTDRFIVENDNMNSHTEAESDMSLKIQIILAQDECSSAKEAVPIFKRCNRRKRQTLCDMGMFMSSTLQASVFMGRITQKIYIPSKIQEKISQWNRCSTYLRNW